MNKKNNKEKRTKDDMSVRELSIIFDKGFRNIQIQLNELKADLIAGFDRIAKRTDNFSTFK